MTHVILTTLTEEDARAAIKAVPRGPPLNAVDTTGASMNVKAWIPLVVAIVLGGIAAKVGRDMMSRKQPSKVETVNVTQIAVAKDNISPGTSLKLDALLANTVQETSVPPGAFRDRAALLNRVVTMPVLKGQPILENMLAPKGSSGGLTAVVPDGMRAVTLEVNEVSGVAGMLLPGCRIDIVTTLAGDGGGMVARTIARNLQIVAVGRKFNEGSKDQPREEGPEPIARTVTLLVNPKEAELIDLAAHTGTPRLVLRGSRDSSAGSAGDSESGVTLAELRGNLGERSGIGGMLTRMIENVSKMPPPTKSLFNDAPWVSPTTKPSESIRMVTVIRATKEQAVQIERRFDAAGKMPVAETDKSDAVGN